MLKTILVATDGSDHARRAVDLAADLAAVLADAEAAVRAKGVAEVEAVVEQGDTAQHILDKAAQSGADMIVMGSRGLGGLEGLLMGSVSQKVSHLAPCTCATVR